MKKLFTLLLTLATLACQAQPGTPAKQATPPKAAVAPKTPPASTLVQSQPNQPIYLTLAPEAKAQQSTGTNYTLVAAIIAAIASLTSAYISFKSKDKDFKNDYYKKIIDRRLIAYEALEGVVAAFGRRRVIDIRTSVGISTQEVYAFFISDNEFDEFNKRLIDLHDKTLWFSIELKKSILNIQLELARIGNGFHVYIGQNIGEDALRLAGIKNDDKLKQLRKKLVYLFKNEIREIQDISKFFKSLDESPDDGIQ